MIIDDTLDSRSQDHHQLVGLKGKRTQEASKVQMIVFCFGACVNDQWIECNWKVEVGSLFCCSVQLSTAISSSCADGMID